MTFAELTAAALGDSFDATRRGADARRYINHAYKRFARRLGFTATEARATVTTTSGVDTYDVPPDFQLFAGGRPVWLSGEPLEHTDRQELEDRGAATGAKATSFAFYEDKVVLWPVPTDEFELTMYYRAGPTSMTDDLDEPIIPEDTHEILVLYARGRLYQDEDDYDAGAQALALFEQEMREYHRDMGAKTTFRRRVPGTWNQPTRPSFRLPS